MTTDVAIVGAGGIGFDVAEFLVTPPGHSPTLDLAAWQAEWGVRDPAEVRGGVVRPAPTAPARQITLLQRKKGKLGRGLGKTTGWIHRATLKAKGVRMLGGVEYERIDDDGLHLRVDGTPQVLVVDHVVVCAGQESRRDLLDPLRAAGMEVHVVGGADAAAELDAKRAIAQASRVAAML